MQKYAHFYINLILRYLIILLQLFQHVKLTLNKLIKLTEINNTKKMYGFRTHKRVIYAEISDPESDPDAERAQPTLGRGNGCERRGRGRGRRSNRAIDLEPTERREIELLASGWRCHVRRQNYRRPRIMQNMEHSNPTVNNHEQILTMETGPSSNVELVQNTIAGETSSNNEPLQNTTATAAAAAETTSILETSSHDQQAVRQPFKRKTILSWLIDCKIIRVGDLVQYRTNLDGTNKTYELVTGRICNGAIICSCCGDEFSIWNFEKHLGSNRGQPYDHITIHKTSTSTPTCLIDCIMLS